MFTPTANLRPVITSAFDVSPLSRDGLTSVSLCHRLGTFFKDLQTNFPETFRAGSSIHRSCFTLPVFTKNRQKLEAPQHMPAKPFAIAQNAVTHLMSPSILQPLRASNAHAFILGTFAPQNLGPFFALCHFGTISRSTRSVARFSPSRPRRRRGRACGPAPAGPAPWSPDRRGSGSPRGRPPVRLATRAGVSCPP